MTTIGEPIKLSGKIDTLNKMMNSTTMLELSSASACNEEVYVDVCAVV